MKPPCSCPGRNGYSNECAIHGRCTVTEQLDAAAAEGGDAFGAVLMGLFGALERARDEEEA